MACRGCERRRKIIVDKSDRVVAALASRGLTAPANAIERAIYMLGWKKPVPADIIADRVEKLGQAKQDGPTEEQ